MMITDPVRTKLAIHIFLTFLFCIVRSFRNKDLSQSDAFDIAISWGGAILSISLLIRAFDPKVTSLLQEDIIAVATASTAQVVASLSLEIKNDLSFLVKLIQGKTNQWIDRNNSED